MRLSLTTQGEKEGKEQRNPVKGFRWEENQWKSEPYLGDGVFGGIITTTNDYVKYAAYHQSVWPIEGREDPDLGMGVKTVVTKWGNWMDFVYLQVRSITPVDFLSEAIWGHHSIELVKSTWRPLE
jgi:hypothetical protein